MGLFWKSSLDFNSKAGKLANEMSHSEHGSCSALRQLVFVGAHCSLLGRGRITTYLAYTVACG